MSESRNKWYVKRPDAGEQVHHQAPSMDHRRLKTKRKEIYSHPEIS